MAVCINWERLQTGTSRLECLPYTLPTTLTTGYKSKGGLPRAHFHSCISNSEKICSHVHEIVEFLPRKHHMHASRRILLKCHILALAPCHAETVSSCSMTIWPMSMSMSQKSKKINEQKERLIDVVGNHRFLYMIQLLCDDHRNKLGRKSAGRRLHAHCICVHNPCGNVDMETAYIVQMH